MKLELHHSTCGTQVASSQGFSSNTLDHQIQKAKLRQLQSTGISRATGSSPPSQVSTRKEWYFLGVWFQTVPVQNFFSISSCLHGTRKIYRTTQHLLLQEDLLNKFPAIDKGITQ